MPKITTPTPQERQIEIRSRLLLAFSVAVGRREPLALSLEEYVLLGLVPTMETWQQPWKNDDTIRKQCEQLIVDAILAGGYR